VKWQWDGADAEMAAKQPHYNKFKHFPYVYSQFTLDQADEVLKETKEFLVNFLGHLKKNVPTPEFDQWWPVELCKWSETGV
jgi:hypothetical protein